MNCEVIMVTSCKGGVGKSTISANLGYTLASHGHEVLLIDLDFSMRCLDMILGLENRVVYDIKDACTKNIPISKIICRYPKCKDLHFIAAPYSDGEELSEERFTSFIKKIKKHYDYIIIDTPGDTGYSFGLACDVSDLALIVSSQGPTTVRAAEKTADLLDENGVLEYRLVINNYDMTDAKNISSGKRTGIVDIIEKTKIKLLGVIPYDKEMSDFQENGMLAYMTESNNIKKAFENIAGRLEKKEIPLFYEFKRISKKKLI